MPTRSCSQDAPALATPFRATVANVLVVLVLVVVALAIASGSAHAQGVRHEIDHQRSTVHVVTRRAGALGFLGHDHAILATRWTGSICFAPDDPSASEVRVTVATPSLVIDTDLAVEVAGTSWRPGPDTMLEIRTRMLGPEFLDADEHPEIRFASRSVTSDGDDDLIVEGPFTLHGRTRIVRAPVTVTPAPDGTVRFEVRMSVRMTDYGIEPETNLGVVDVADEFDLFVDVLTRPTSEPCP
ncbi:MAG: YceI family protein [Trueperaceae bacterium]|nr:YceI family protein [Trueperaceae bacterium]